MKKYFVHHPSFPNDPSKVVFLDDEQLEVVLDYIIMASNEHQGRGKPSETKILRMLEEAGCPVIFESHYDTNI